MSWRVLSALGAAVVGALSGTACSKRQPQVVETPVKTSVTDEAAAPQAVAAPRPSTDDLTEDIERVLEAVAKSLIDGLIPIVGEADRAALLKLDHALGEERKGADNPSGVRFRLDPKSLEMTGPATGTCLVRRSGRGTFTLFVGPKVLIGRGRLNPPLDPNGPTVSGLPADPAKWKQALNDPVTVGRLQVRRKDEAESFTDYSLLTVVDYSNSENSPKHPDQVEAIVTPGGRPNLFFAEVEIRDKPIRLTFQTSADGRKLTMLTSLDGKPVDRYFREATVGHGASNPKGP